MPLTVHFVRHGESQANVDQVFSNRVDHPAPLTPVGVEQARVLARTLARIPVTHVYTSPLQRARETADAIASEAGLEPAVCEGLREYDVGEFEGLPYGGSNAWRWREYERVDAAWRAGNRDVRLAGGESLTDMEKRFGDVMTRIAQSHAPTDQVVVVSHGGLYRVLLPLIFAEISPDFALAHPLGHCESIVADWQEGEWQCRQWGNTSLANSPLG